MNNKERVKLAFNQIKASNDIEIEVQKKITNYKKNKKTFMTIIMGIIITTGFISSVDAMNDFKIIKNIVLRENILRNNKNIEDNTNYSTLNGFIISYPFKETKEETEFDTNHKGIDLVASIGTDVYSAMDGIVKETGSNDKDGNYIVIKHSDIYETKYACLNEILVKPYDQVNENSIIGKVGSTGHSTGPHLHFELIENNIPVNPLNYMKNTQ